ncbi:uncharacterized protein [Halyomorpha halys]|uniref:uncharacterized protein n=1 Tax=Halyomorpha halys TaxID=286706 RepID=UPI0034D2FDCD
MVSHYFLCLNQHVDKSISDYVAALKRNLKDCDFYTICSCKKKISIADTFLRAQFIRGLKDGWIREQLVQDASLKDFDAIVKKATALEASRYESSQLEPSTGKFSEPPVDTFKKSKTNTLSTQHCPVEEESLSDTEYEIGRIQNSEDSFNLGSDRDKYLVTVKLNSKPQTFEVDSSARFSLISEPAFRKLQSLDTLLEPTTVSFRSYSDHIIKPMGKVTLTVTYKNRTIDAESYVVPAGHDALLGRIWIRGLGISLNKIDINIQYSSIFEPKVGCVPNVEATTQRGIASSDWGSPLVVIAKPDGGVRLCVDYKCGVNSKLVAANHSIRRIDKVLHSLRGSKYFCKLDLHKAYLHLKVDEEGSKIQTISTHKGTYRMNRLSFGIKTAPSEFNRILSQILHGLPNVEAYFDDIICHGADLDECTKDLMACLERLKENDLHLNKSKWSFFKEKIDYLGHVVSSSTEAAFVDLKSELCSERVLTPFDPSKPVILTTDASSPIISHSIDDVEQPVAMPLEL